MEKKNELELRKKFIKNYGLPIHVDESPWFEYFLILYEPEYKTRTLWEGVCREIDENYGGSSEKYLQTYSEIRGRIIESIQISEEYKNFLTSNIPIPTFNEIGSSLYIEQSDGKRFVSLDMRKANFQAMRWAGVIKDKNYETFIKKWTSLESFIRSKQNRQIIFGQLSPSRQTKIVKFLISEIYRLVKTILPKEFILYSLKTDEILFEVPRKFQIPEEIKRDVPEMISKELGIDVEITIFDLKMVKRFTSTGKAIKGFVKEFIYPTKPPVLKNVPSMYFPQIYKAWKGIQVNNVYDLVFKTESELAHLDLPLRI